MSSVSRQSHKALTFMERYSGSFESSSYPKLAVSRVQQQLAKADAMGLDVTAGDLQDTERCKHCGIVLNGDEPRDCCHSCTIMNQW